jgi:3-hydroxy-9,10-secoandrosta-1,3,5(10)-triene-9,17-dione monooxygenase
MYHGWLAPLLISEVAAVSVGAARGALDVYEQILSNKKTNFPPFHLRSQEAEFQQHFGEAQALIDTAEAALLKLTADYMDLAREHVARAAPLDEERERRLILMEQRVAAGPHASESRRYSHACNAAAGPYCHQRRPLTLRSPADQPLLVDVAGVK